MLRQKILKMKKPDITNLGKQTTLNAKMNEVKGEIPNITDLTSTSALTAVGALPILCIAGFKKRGK